MSPAPNRIRTHKSLTTRHALYRCSTTFVFNSFKKAAEQKLLKRSCFYATKLSKTCLDLFSAWEEIDWSQNIPFLFQKPVQNNNQLLQRLVLSISLTLTLILSHSHSLSLSYSHSLSLSLSFSFSLILILFLSLSLSLSLSLIISLILTLTLYRPVPAPPFDRHATSKQPTSTEIMTKDFNGRHSSRVVQGTAIER